MFDPRWGRRFRRNRGALVGLALVAAVLAVAFLGPLLSPYDPNEQLRDGLGVNGIPRAPDLLYWLGTDALGRDELSRLLHGGLVSLEVALFATSIALALGIAVGVTAGYFGAATDAIAMRCVDVLLSLPFLLIAIALNRAVSEPSLLSLQLLLGGLSWPALARVMRGKVLQVKGRDFVVAARALGASRRRILLAHVLPNVAGPAIVMGTTMIADMILAESAMSFLGLGVAPPQASWGSMLYEGRDFIAYAPHLLVLPGLLITATVFGFNLLGEGLQDALDPR